MRLLKQSAAANVMVFMTDSADHVSGKASLTLTVTASKDGAAFASISTTVTDRGSGWYNLALAAGDTNTLGDLALHVTAAGADPTDLACRIVAGSLDADVSTRLATAGYTAPDNAGIATLTSRLTAGRATNLDNLDATVSSRSTYAGADTAGTTTLLARLTSGRATLLDNLANLDAAISVLTGRLTAGRATNLDNLNVTVSSRAVPGDAMALTAAAVDAVWDEVVELTYTARQLVRLIAAVNLGKSSGMSTTAPKFRDLADSKDRVAGTADSNGNRTAVTLDAT